MKNHIAIILSMISVLLLVACSKSTVSVEVEGVEERIADVAEDTKWGITLTAENVTSTSLLIMCSQSVGNPSGELQTGSWYILEESTEEGWAEVEWIPQEYDVAWTSEAWLIPMESTAEWEVNWEWLYGELPAGQYRIGKSIMDFRGTGDYDTDVFYAEFTIEK